MTDDGKDDLDDLDESKLPVKIAKEQLLKEFGRPRGIFTETDRRFMRGYKKYKHKQSRTNRRQNIRERIIHSLHDFRLFAWLDEDERNKIVREIPAGELHDDIVSLLAFVYRGIGKDKKAIEQMVERAVYQVEAEGSSEIESVSVDIDINVRPDIDEMYKRYTEDSDRLTPGEIGILVRAGRLDRDDLAELAARDESAVPDTTTDTTPWYMEQERDRSEE
jgi:hypothetical protein